jgi:hypothetical protein
MFDAEVALVVRLESTLSRAGIPLREYLEVTARS